MREAPQSTNGLLKRYIALHVIKYANAWSFGLLLLPIILLVLNGLSWIHISIESITAIMMGTTSLIQMIQSHKSQIVNFYFERDNNELENGHKDKQVTIECSRNKDTSGDVQQ